MTKAVENAALEGKFLAAQTQNIGVCCLSRQALDLLMWAHYTQNHTGFVVEFSIPRKGRINEQQWVEKAPLWLLPFVVQYSAEKPMLDLNDETLTNMNKAYLTKSKEWEYECEERVLDYRRGHGIHRYERETILKSVVAGMRMSEENFETLGNEISNLNEELGTNVTLHRATVVPHKYALEVCDRPDIVA